ncbi:hypothetical protein H6F67_21980 [Microcoleus sp. FACHB-1515]|uniref:hypothetical protein n=2 Tax=Cyanophyceae TaxID=3028117 RepID=UPI0016854315|nr:hypothetical protein [Microcoleus sp. FACHB-1515]MBD2092521.1 hypothetical protein [Microcoleus sp. FACHB-1515]
MSRPNERGDTPLLQIPSAFRFPEDSRYVVKHVLIGQPIAVDRTILHLQQLRYADATTWARPLAVGEPLLITPAPGDVISVLTRYLRIE